LNATGEILFTLVSNEYFNVYTDKPYLCWTDEGHDVDVRINSPGFHRTVSQSGYSS